MLTLAVPPLPRPLLPASETDGWLGDLGPLRAGIRGVIAAVLRLPAGDPEVEDCVGEVFRRALEGRERLRPGEPLRPWVLGIARHVALDARRARARAFRREDDAEKLDSLAAPQPLADEQVAERRRLARLEKALASLPPREREALVLFHGEGLDYRGVAERMNAPMGSVATWLSRARKTLSERLREGTDA